MENHDYGYVIRKSDAFYIVDVDPGIYNSGYGVVSKEEDPYGKYDLEDVIAWAEAHPDRVLSEHPLEAEMQLQEQLRLEQSELEAINRQLFDAMVDTVFGSAAATMSLAEDDAETGDASVEALLEARAAAKAAIAEIKDQLEALAEAREAS